MPGIDDSKPAPRRPENQQIVRMTRMYAVAVGEHSRTLFPRNVENTMKVSQRPRPTTPCSITM